MKVEKRDTFSNDIVFIDGLWGTGKSLLSPIVSSMDRVEKVKSESVYEYMSWLYQLDKIRRDAAVWMLRTYADMGQYHNVIGRETNLRWGDDTGLKNASNVTQLISRLFEKDGDYKIEHINNNNLAFCVMSHMLMLAPELLFEAYGDRVKVVEMVRHPLHMVAHFEAYLSRFDSPREFTISYYHNQVKVPWFMNEWAGEYVNGNAIEQAVLCITKLYPLLNEKVELSKKNGLELLDLSFEESVFDTGRTLEKLQVFLGRSHHPRINRVLKKQKLPRDMISKGKGHASYGWQGNNKKTEEDNYQDMLGRVKSGCSKELVEQLDTTIAWYNEKYPSKLSRFA